MIRFLKTLWFWGWGNTKSIRSHFSEFPYIWILLFVLASMTFFSKNDLSTATALAGISLFLLTALVLIRPMNAVYGLMGTSGSIRLFFVNFILITIIFTCIYYFGFFQNAGITYHVNQPHIDYVMFAERENTDSTKITEIRDTVYVEHQLDSIVFKEKIIHISSEALHYQKIDFGDVWRGTILTTLTQEPTELFSEASIYNEEMADKTNTIDKQKSRLFHWILIFHIIISWIFFGVFISLLYNKFRYES